MTSGNFSIVPVASITIDREKRQRRELRNIEELAESIRKTGLINPIVITSDYVLVAGERRLTAHKHLKFDSIAVQFAEDLEETDLQLIELEENVRRSDLDWQDQVRAVAQFDQLKKETTPDWGPNNSAEELNMSRSHFNRMMLVNEFLDKGTPEVAEAAKLSVAANFAQRAKERQKTAVMRDLIQDEPKAVLTPETGGLDVSADISEEAVTAAISRRRVEILNKSFLDWAGNIQQDPYNLIHCDFPYGVNAGDKVRGQAGREKFGGYVDTADVYWELLDTLLEKQDNFISPSAHMIFWFSMDYYEQTRKAIQAAGWVVSPFPLVWFKSDNTGVLPDKDRGPRRIYETALFCTRGDRKIVRAVGNCFGCGVKKEFHMSEKAVPMLEHFLRMLVDETTKVLDPTCGSANALKVAENLGATWSTGLEMNKEFASRACENLGIDPPP